MLARPCALVHPRCAVLSGHNFCVATQSLPALTTPCCDTGHGRDTGSKGFCRDPSHPVPTQTLLRHGAKQSLSRQRSYGQSVATEELWVVCRDKDFISRQAFRLVMPARVISVVHAIACTTHLLRALPHAIARLCCDTRDPIATQS